MDGIEFLFSQETPSTFIASLLKNSKDIRVTVWAWLVFVNWTICKSHSPVSTFASEMMPVDPESVNYLPSWTMHPSQNSTHPAAKRTYLFHFFPMTYIGRWIGHTGIWKRICYCYECMNSMFQRYWHRCLFLEKRKNWGYTCWWCFTSTIFLSVFKE